MNVLIDKMKDTFDKITHKKAWDKYYKKNERKIEVPNLSAYEYLRECN